MHPKSTCVVYAYALPPVYYVVCSDHVLEVTSGRTPYVVIGRIAIHMKNSYVCIHAHMYTRNSGPVRTLVDN